MDREGASINPASLHLDRLGLDSHTTALNLRTGVNFGETDPEIRSDTRIRRTHVYT